MENDLDDIAEGKITWQNSIGEFYKPFHENLEIKYKEVEKENMDEATDQICEKCGKPMIIKTGRFGKFLACSNFPECKNTKTIKKTIGLPCSECNEGEIVKKNKTQKNFLGLFPIRNVNGRLDESKKKKPKTHNQHRALPHDTAGQPTNNENC